VSLVIDTGVLVAAGDVSDPAHGSSRKTLEQAMKKGERLMVPALVLAETAYLLETAGVRPAVVVLVQNLLAGVFRLEPPMPEDLRRAIEIEEQYAVGLTDGTVAALAERIGCRIATLDRRHFSALRTRKGKPFKLVP